MFQNNRYATKGVSEDVPLLTQLLLWSLIDDLDTPKVDCLQVFKLTAENGKQRIVHEQEQPAYHRELLFDFAEPVNEKIYVIDDGEHSTMLLAEEY